MALFYCRLCGYYEDRDEESCPQCKRQALVSTSDQEHLARCLNKDCVEPFLAKEATFKGCKKCGSPRVRFLRPEEYKALGRPIPRGSPTQARKHVVNSFAPKDIVLRSEDGSILIGRISVDVVVLYVFGDAAAGRSAEEVLTEVHGKGLSHLADIWDLPKEKRAELPGGIGDPEVQWAAIYDVFVRQNGLYLLDDPIPLDDGERPDDAFRRRMIRLTRAPELGYRVDLIACDGNASVDPILDRGVPTPPNNWDDDTAAAWTNFLQHESIIPTYTSSPSVQIAGPEEIAWPKPPPMTLDLGSKASIEMCEDYETSFIGAVNIYSGIVYTFPLIPHPAYYGDYRKGPSPGGRYIPNPEKRGEICSDPRFKRHDPREPFVYKPKRDIISAEIALKHPDEVGGTPEHGVLVDGCPMVQRVWEWDTGRLMHGIFHKQAPAVIYRCVAPADPGTSLSAHIKLVQSVLGSHSDHYVGFTYYRREGLTGGRRKYLRPNSTGCNGHKFVYCLDYNPADRVWKYNGINPTMPPDWLKALFACFYKSGLFDYFGPERYQEELARGKQEEQKRADELRAAVTPSVPLDPNGPTPLPDSRHGLGGDRDASSATKQQDSSIPVVVPPQPPAGKVLFDQASRLKKAGNRKAKAYEKVVGMQAKADATEGASTLAAEINEKPTAPAAPPIDRCTRCKTYLSWRWPGRCLNCHPLDHESFPKWDGAAGLWKWKDLEVCTKSEACHAKNGHAPPCLDHEGKPMASPPRLVPAAGAMVGGKLVRKRILTIGETEKVYIMPSLLKSKYGIDEDTMKLFANDPARFVRVRRNDDADEQVKKKDKPIAPTIKTWQEFEEKWAASGKARQTKLDRLRGDGDKHT